MSMKRWTCPLCGTISQKKGIYVNRQLICLPCFHANPPEPPPREPQSNVLDLPGTHPKPSKASQGVGKWAIECCEQGPYYWTASLTLYRSYASWCKTEGFTPTTQNGFTMTLKARGFNTKVKRNQKRGVQGLRLIQN